MKKVFLIASILFAAVVSTACINNFAVQDLNNKAKVYADKGDYVQAIERLKSSIDLDPTIVETHYNLAVAYSQVEDYVNSIEEFKKVLEMKPEMVDTYYSLATAENNLAIDMSQGKVRMGEDGSLQTMSAESLEGQESSELTENEKAFVTELYDSAIANYRKYLELSSNADDKAEVEEQIKVLEEAKNPKETAR